MGDCVRAPIEPKKAREIYDSLSQVYDYLTLYEGGAKRRGLDAAGVKPGQRVLEVGFGTGQSLMRIMEKNKGGETFGIELSPMMLRKARRRIVGGTSEAGSAFLLVADAGHIPFRDGYFEIAFNSYMLDLMDSPAISAVLQEIKRVLEPGGRLVLVSLSKGKGLLSNMKAYEWLYGISPTVFAGCRPLLLEPMVREAGFCNIRREFLMAGRIMPSEVIYCEKPSG